jgi:hyaluronate lyase
VLPELQASELKAVLKGYVQRDTSFGASYYTPVAAPARRADGA